MPLSWAVAMQFARFAVDCSGVLHYRVCGALPRGFPILPDSQQLLHHAALCWDDLDDTVLCPGKALTTA